MKIVKKFTICCDLVIEDDEVTDGYWDGEKFTTTTNGTDFLSNEIDRELKKSEEYAAKNEDTVFNVVHHENHNTSDN